MEVRIGERDFFVSYRSADQAWAEWIAWELEDAGYTTFVQAWDFRPGQNFVHQMQQGASSCRRIIAVLTPAYFESGFTRAEWYSAFAKDPTGDAGLLLPVRVAECDIDGLLGQIIYIDLVGLEKTQARERLLAGIEGTRAKPAQAPEFPRIFPDDRNIRVVPPLPPPSAEDRRGLLILLDRVKRFWVEGVLEQSVQHEALINLGKETKADAVEHPWEQVLELPDVASKPLPVDTRITDVFEDVGRLLLILGDPGSGKTMTLLELARDLVARATSDPSQPVPVVYNLSSWNEEFRGFADWLTEELKTKYRIPKRIGRSWLDGNRLLLLLDGLDEVQAERRAACIRAINAFLEDQGTSGVAVCSRIQEYTAAPVRLKMNAAICLQPLTATQIETYLSRLGSQLDALCAALNKDDVLRELASSPLMLSVMMLAHQGASVAALPGHTLETPEARRTQIFDTYIDRMFAIHPVRSVAKRRDGRKAKAAATEHAKEQTKSSLSWLAHNMQRHGQSALLIEGMQPSWLINYREILVYLLVSRLATVAAIWVAIFLGVTATGPSLWRYLLSGTMILTFPLGVFYSCSIDLLRHNVETRLSTPSPLRKIVTNPFLVVFAHMLGWTAAATVINMLSPIAESVIDYVPSSNGATYGLMFGILYCRRSVSRDIRIHDRLMWSWTWPIVVIITASIVIALYYILVATTSFWMATREDAEIFFTYLVFVVISSVLWAPLFFLLGLRSGIQEDKGAVTYGMRAALVSACRAGLGMLCCVLGVNFLLAFMLDLPFSQFELIKVSVIISTIPVIAVVIGFGGVDVINHYAIRFIAYCNGYVPNRLHQFLNDCTKLVFLRRVGGGFIFIHRLLLEHFAAMWEAEHKQKKISGRRASEDSGTSCHPLA